VVEIVGIVGDVQQRSGLSSAYGPLAFTPTLYVPVSQTSDGFLQLVHTWFSPKWVVRGAGARSRLEAGIRGAVARVDPQLPIAAFDSAEDLQARSISGQRYHAALFSMLAGLGVLLAGLGVYGLLSQSVAQRTQELGIRLALGAVPARIIANVVRSSLGLAAAGIAAGAILAL